MKIKVLVGAFLIGNSSLSCDMQAAENKLKVTSMKQSTMDTYRCPMDPTVSGRDGEVCPNCGMELKILNHDTEGTYYMDFGASEERITPKKDLTFTLIPRKRAQEDRQVPLMVVHEKQIHLVVVSDDLSWFNHIHPEMNESGEFTITTSFPHAGKYTLFADYQPEGGRQVVDKFEINVEGQAPEQKEYSTANLTGFSDGYSFTIVSGKAGIETGSGNDLSGIIKKDGKSLDLSTLDNYLGEKAHIVIVRAEGKEYLHVHPMVVNGKLAIHADFNKPGIYRGWVQFKDKQQVHTIDFTLLAVQGDKHFHYNEAGQSHGGHSH